MDNTQPYDGKLVGSTIKNIHRGKGARQHTVYAELVAADGTLLVAATLMYIYSVLEDHFPFTE